MNTLDKARKFEKEKGAFITQRPMFHVTPRVGWMNDPNGFSLYQGEAHLFYQYHPYDTVWGPMHWGHCKTKDFIKWEDLPAALAPDESYDFAGCFSGSAIENNEKHVLFYTGVKEQTAADGTKQVFQNQCIAVGNGIDYEKILKTPVIDGRHLPDGCSNADFRDPKVWSDGDKFYMVVGSKNQSQDGQVLLFRSETLEDWEHVSVLAANRKRFGKMWECPDFFELDEKNVLIVSPQEMSAQEYEFHNGNNVIYFVGSYDKEHHSYTEEHVAAVDYGLDFYAPQTMTAADGRRIMIGWMQSWDTYFKPQDQNWMGMMTIPRELSIKANRLVQSPVRELENYRRNKVAYRQEIVAGSRRFEGISGRILDLSIELISGDYEQFAVHFAHNEKYTVACSYNKRNGILRFDRTHSGVTRDIACSREMKVQGSSEGLKLRLILDKYSAEIFVNDGRQVLSSVFYTPLDAQEIVFKCDGSVKINVEKYDIVVA